MDVRRLLSQGNYLLAMAMLLTLSHQPLAEAWWLGDLISSRPPQPQNEFMKAIANFDMNGVQGSFKFMQKNASEPTQIDFDLRGLNGNNNLYHVHVRPVPSFDPENVRRNVSLAESLCSDQSTGGHLNPYGIKTKLPPKSAPHSEYEVGDLGGKHGPLPEVPGHQDHYVGSLTDFNLPLSGENSIIGRSIVIHKKDTGKRWVCATIVEDK